MDLSQYKSISINGIAMKKVLIGGVVAWKKPAKNWVPVSTDTDGSIYNGVGYKENVRLGSNGSVSSSAQNGSVTTGFIPFPNGDKTVIRLKGVEWLNANANHGGHFYIHFYNASKKVIASNLSLYSGDTATYSHIVTVTRDSNGVETIVWSQTYGDSNAFLNHIRTDAAFFRLNAYGKGKDMIVTVDEEI